MYNDTYIFYRKANFDKMPNENHNHGVFSPISSSLFNSNSCFTNKDSNQSVLSSNMMNQSNMNDYKNVFNPNKPNFTNQVENGVLNLQQSFNNFNNSNSNVNYLNNYFINLQNAFLSNPELFKSNLNPPCQNFQNMSQFNILENLLNANCMKQTMNSVDFNQLGRQLPNNQMQFQSQKNIYFSNNPPYRLNLPIYKPTSTFPHPSSQFSMDNMTNIQCNFNFNQHNQQLLNNSMLFKNQMDLKANNK